jgi:putative oxidoreductase
MFMLHGAQKLFGLFGGFMGTEGATAPLVSLMGFAGVLEFFGGLAVMIGLFTQPVAFILSGQWPLPTSWSMCPNLSGPSKTAENMALFTRWFSCSWQRTEPASSAWINASARRLRGVSRERFDPLVEGKKEEGRPPSLNS